MCHWNMITKLQVLNLITLAHTAWEQEGVLGARMTGAGLVDVPLHL